jgi:predicted methyltransferase
MGLFMNLINVRQFLLVLTFVQLSGCTLMEGNGSAARIDSAIANPNRTDADRERDGRDKPADILALLDLSPGDRVADMFGGGGYYAELLAGVVGGQGEVILHNNRGYAKWVDQYLRERYIDNTVPPIRVLFSEADDMQLPDAALDAVIMVMSYHDLYYVNAKAGFPGTDVADFFAQISAALKPGGKLLIIDHAAPDGSGADSVQEVHRIDPLFALQDIESKGFALVATSDVLRNPDDPRTMNVFAKNIRGNTDRFVMLFEKST